MQKSRVKEFIKNPKKALFTLALPIMMGMLVQTLYNIVDTAFVGRLGAEAIAALTFSFPIFFIFIALNSGLGAGIGSVISRAIGAKKKKLAENAAMHGLIVSVILGLIVVILCLIFLRPMFVLFGAEGLTLELSIDYMFVVLVGALFMFVSFAMHSIFSGQGDTKTPMIVQVSTLVLNIILDPIFIYVLGYGVKGAAIATVISFVFGFLMFIYYINKKSYLNIKLSNFKFDLKIIKDMIFVGAPSSLTVLVIAIYIVFINKFAAHFGVDYVAALGMAFRGESVAIMPIVAFAMAMLTLTGMFYGAKRFDLLRGIVWYGVKMVALFTAVIGAVFFIIPELFLKIFTSDFNLLSLGAAYLRLDVFTFPLMGISFVFIRAMQGIGYGWPGLVVNLIRVFVFAVPLSYVFIFILDYGYLSLIVAAIVGALVSATIAAGLFYYVMEKEKIK